MHHASSPDLRWWRLVQVMLPDKRPLPSIITDLSQLSLKVGVRCIVPAVCSEAHITYVQHSTAKLKQQRHCPCFLRRLGALAAASACVATGTAACMGSCTSSQHKATPRLSQQHAVHQS